MRAVFGAFLLTGLLAACGQPGEYRGAQAEGAQAEGAQAEGADKADGAQLPTATEEVEGIVTALTMGDLLWATVEVKGRDPIQVQPGEAPIDLFLNAHLGKPLVLEIATMREFVPEAGGEVELKRIVSARSGSLTAQSWWDQLSPSERGTVQAQFEAGPLSSGVNDEGSP